jgi:hypothetical protein
MNVHDIKLKAALKAWRTQQMEIEFSGDDFFGPQLLLSDEILNRIVGLARNNKLTDIQSLNEQTDWRHTSKYGSAIIEMVKNCASPPPPPPLPPPSSAPSSSFSRPTLQGVSNLLPQVTQHAPLAGQVPKKPCRSSCAACGKEGHICMYSRHRA